MPNSASIQQKPDQLNETLTTEDKVRLVELLREAEARRKYNKLAHFTPYEWQVKLANSSSSNKQMLAMCANQIGKSTAGAFITACHLTGKYPEWYTGHRFDKPIYCWAAGVSNDTTRDIIQTELFGLAESADEWGTGMVPKSDIRDCTRRRGATGNTFDSVLVQHYNAAGEPDGVSRIGFKSYEMGEEKFYGRPVDWIWMDEQPPSNIYTQCITRTVATKGYTMMTFTPEDGVTPVVHQFMHDRKPGQFLLQASWDDAPHLDEATKEQLLSQYPPHERELRSKGIPVFGSGLVFPVSEDVISVQPFIIPDAWPRIAAIDFGWDHPTAVVWMAHDTETDTVYVYDVACQNNTTAATFAGVINSRERWIPLAWPKDGLQSDKGSGVSLADQYRQAGVNMLHDWARNPIAPGDTSKGNNHIEPGIMDMLQRMESDRFKVFAHLQQWFLEFRGYHRKDGKIAPVNDDIMSATRYGVISLRFARTGDSSNNGFNMKKINIQNWSCV